MDMGAMSLLLTIGYGCTDIISRCFLLRQLPHKHTAQIPTPIHTQQADPPHLAGRRSCGAEAVRSTRHSRAVGAPHRARVAGAAVAAARSRAQSSRGTVPPTRARARTHPRHVTICPSITKRACAEATERELPSRAHHGGVVDRPCRASSPSAAVSTAYW